MCRGLTELHWIGYSTELNMDSKIQIKYVESKNQLADMMTKGSFTRDELNYLLHLFNIMNHTTTSRSHFFLSNRKQAVMSKRLQESCSLDSPTVKARSTSFNLVSHQGLSCQWDRTHKWRPIPQSRWVPGLKMCRPALGNHCYKTRQEIRCWALKRGHRETKSKMIPNILNSATAQLAVGRPLLLGLDFLVRVVKVKF